jgi:hypothetical protein
MLKRFGLSAFLVICCLSVARAEDAPATQPAVVQASDTAALNAKKGETVTVEGVVESARWSSSGKVLNVVFKDTEKDKGLLCAAFDKNKEKLDAAFGGDAPGQWNGAKVRITGKVENYGGKIEAWKDRPQILIQYPEQVVIVEPKK